MCLRNLSVDLYCFFTSLNITLNSDAKPSSFSVSSFHANTHTHICTSVRIMLFVFPWLCFCLHTSLMCSVSASQTCSQELRSSLAQASPNQTLTGTSRHCFNSPPRTQLCQ